MWSISQAKSDAKSALKKNYWALIFICFSLLFLEIVPGTGTAFMELQTASVTGEASDLSADVYTPGLLRYLSSIVEGKTTDQQQAIAQEVMKSFNGLGGNVYGIVRAIDRFVFSNQTAAKVLIVLSFIIWIIYTYMIKNQIYVGFCRITMDGQQQDRKIRFSDLFQIFRSRGYLNVAKVSFLWQGTTDLILFAGLSMFTAAVWYATSGNSVILTILFGIGGAALCAYFCFRFMVWAMVPYILASNPEAPARETFALSKAMMDGNKWKLFKLRLSYIGWDILAILTLGLADIFYLCPAQYMAYGSVYLKLREKALNENTANAQIVAGETYALRELAPNRLGKLIEDNNPERHYDLVNIVLLFFIFAFVGWCWEVLIHIVKDGVFVNRGTMHGPWLPIYGFGGAGIIYFLRRFARKPWLLIVSIFCGCGVLEYIAHWYLEVTKGTKWWDYSNYFLNLNGRICFEGLFVFCLAGVFAVYVAGPALDNLLNRISKKVRWTIAGILLVIFAGDMAYSHKHPNMGKGITDYNKK